jgi:3-methyladenine DNA glycosylase AlkC
MPVGERCDKPECSSGGKCARDQGVFDLKNESIELEPRYSTRDVPGKCIKCLTEQKLDACLRELLSSEADNPEQVRRYEALLAFLQSPESEKLRAESERFLAEGKRAVVKIRRHKGKYQYKLEIQNNTEEGETKS